MYTFPLLRLTDPMSSRCVCDGSVKDVGDGGGAHGGDAFARVGPSMSRYAAVRRII